MRHEIMQELLWSCMDANGSDERATQFVTTLLPSSMLELFTSGLHWDMRTHGI